jgi:serine/threonine-protein kinase
VVARVSVSALIFAVWLRLRRDPVSPAFLRGTDLLMLCATAGSTAGLCLVSGGLLSPYAAMIPVVLLGRGVLIPDHWRRGLWQLGVPAFLYPAILLGAAPFSAEIAAQLRDPAALGVLAFNLSVVLGAWGLLVVAGHRVWALRRQVFESRNIGRYRLRRRIGRGGMGEVWLAHHPGLRRDVAIKLLRPDSGADATAIARFEREVEATTELTHPHTIRIFDHGVTEDGLWFYVMELLEGTDLDSLVEREGPLPPARAVNLIGQAARALAEAHRRGIVHRDVKPANLFVATLGGETDFVKVLDFGIARVSGPRASQLTGTGWIGGTPLYLAPEAASGVPVDAPADVYGLGASLYHALTGTPPFDGPTPMAVIVAHMEREVEPPSRRLGAPLPGALDEIVLRCLAKPPADRYADAGELAQALDAWTRTLGAK